MTKPYEVLRKRRRLGLVHNRLRQCFGHTDQSVAVAEHEVARRNGHVADEPRPGEQRLVRVSA